MRYGDALSPREAEIIGALCMGEKPAEIAGRINVALSTVQTYIRTARIKLGARTLPAAIYTYAMTRRSEI